MSSGPPSCCSEVFSDDLINEILLRLPVKSLLRCKAVSKPWYFLISSPAFVKSHLSNANTKPEADETLIAHAQDNTTIVLVNHISLQLVSHLNFPFSQGEFPFVPDNYLVGSTKGIVCVYQDHPDQRYQGEFTINSLLPGSIYLWNPATKQSLCVMQPTIPSVAEYPKQEYYGFGFDPVDNDFKVVRVLGLPFEAEVYSSNKSVWREIWLEPRLDMFANDHTVCVDGFVCWMGFGSEYIMAFDLNKEVFNCVTKFPEDFNAKDFNAKPFTYYHDRITEVNDSIALVQCQHTSGKVKLWMLNDVESLRGGGGGVEASWTLMLSAIVDMPVFFVNSYFNGGNRLLISIYNKDASVVWLSHQSHEKKATVLPVSSETYHGIFKYTESLVSIPGSRQVTWDASENHHN